MKLAAVAIDYDGTIAVDGVFDTSAREAIAHGRLHGIAVVLEELEHVLGQAHVKRRRIDGSKTPRMSQGGRLPLQLGSVVIPVSETIFRGSTKPRQRPLCVLGWLALRIDPHGAIAGLLLEQPKITLSVRLARPLLRNDCGDTLQRREHDRRTNRHAHAREYGKRCAKQSGMSTAFM